MIREGGNIHNLYLNFHLHHEGLFNEAFDELKLKFHISITIEHI